MMSYHVLARKWRPQTFADLVGQSHVVKALTYALSNNQIHHAYLFTGTRGVGKTSIARIFAKSLNCDTKGVTPDPCNDCESCNEIAAGKFVDLIEVDAASRTGVDETRELIESVAYLPTKGRYKVYLIDEVHMFSKSSFNALLKTLEEPPEHVKFILATTDPEKLPITILSRCLQFNLKSLTQNQIRQHLENICEAESIPYDKSALALLASAGDGSMRDTLSMTDQAIAYGHGKLRLAAVTEILGTIQPADIEAILFAIATNNPNQLSTALHRLDDYEVDARAFLIEIMRRLQRMAWAKEGIVDNLSATLQSTVGDIPKPLLHLWYDIAQKALPNLAIAGEPREAVEMTLLRMLAFTPTDWVPRHRTPLESDTPATDNYSDNSEKVTPQKADQVAFAATVQASPVTEHDSLVAAEAEFSGDDMTPPAETVDKTVTEAANNATADNQQVITETAEAPADTPNPAKTPKQNWHLSSESDHTPTPSMADIQAMMQRGSDIQRPKRTTAAPEVPTNAPNEIPAANNQVSDNLMSADVELEGTPPWEERAVKPEENVQQETTEKPAPLSEVAEAQTQLNPTSLAVDIDNFDWYHVLSDLGLSEYTQHFASMGIVRVATSPDTPAMVVATFDLSPKHEVMITDESLQELSEALQNHFDAPIQLTVNLTQVDDITPAQRNKRESDAQQADLLAQFKNDPMTQKLLNALDAEVLPSTIKARQL